MGDQNSHSTKHRIVISCIAQAAYIASKQIIVVINIKIMVL